MQPSKCNNPDVDPVLTLHATISPTEDGLGFIARCHEIEQIACGENLAEMPGLLAELVASYFAFLRQLGVLQERLEELGPGQADAAAPFVVRLDLHTDTPLSLATSAVELRVA